MGRLRDELAEPWGPLVAGVLGGLSWAVGAPAVAAVGVGAAVYGVKVVAGAILGAPDRRRQGPQPLRPADGTPEAVWLKRAENAVHSLDDMARSAAVTATDLATAHAAEEADAILETMRRVAGQAVAVSRALAQTDSPGLDQEATRLWAAAEATPSDDSARRSADAVADRVAVRDRLRKALQALDGRLQSSTLGLEGLVARVAELQANASAVGELDPSADDLASLTTEVEGLRIGLADVEQVAHKALGSTG
ncbi:MAG: hypothetical protein JWM02_2495 [Frankiales bacterium]|nr:hypothetical protein [Frankiales bacterium]